jgi:branched-chain amino acid transport system permease protein
VQKGLLLQLAINGFATGAIYALVALGFSIIYNTTGVFHVAHGVVYTAASYLLFSTFVTLELPLSLSILLSLLGAVIFGVLIEALIYKPLYKKNAPSVITFVSSLGVYVFFQNLIALIFGNQTQILITKIGETYLLGTAIVSQTQLLQILVSAFVLLLFCFISRYTSFGKSIIAISDNTYLATVIGININRYRIEIFALGSLLAGLGAVLAALDLAIDPNVGFPVVLVAMVSVIIGGIGIIEGAFWGGILIGVAQSLSILQFSAKWQNTVVFLILVAFLLFRPQGLFGFKQRLEEVKL